MCMTGYLTKSPRRRYTDIHSAAICGNNIYFSGLSSIQLLHTHTLKYDSHLGNTHKTTAHQGPYLHRKSNILKNVALGPFLLIATLSFENSSTTGWSQENRTERSPGRG